MSELLRARWDSEIKSKPPADRRRFLKSQEGICALGAAACARLVKQIDREINIESRAVCSSSWLDAFKNAGERIPVYQYNGRRHAVRMILSKCQTQIGEGIAARRFTPPQAVALEDLLDEMSIMKATFYNSPDGPSPTALQLRRISSGRIRVRWQTCKMRPARSATEDF